MLTNLDISNIVLIDKLSLEFGAGLNVLTGETGAGKSILLDALSLALGARSDAGLVRHGCDSAFTVATFNNISDVTKQILDGQGIEYDDELILRRTLCADGKSKAWINDTPVSVKTLKSVGDTLLEIHGQFANHTLLNQATHRPTLDAFAENNTSDFKQLLQDVKEIYQQYKTTQKRLNELQELITRSELERDFLVHNVQELQSMNVQPGEEESLAIKRANIMNAEKNTAILNEALENMSLRGNSLESQIFNVAHILQRIRSEPNPYSEQIDKLYEVAEVIAEITQSLSPETIDSENADAIEERLFAIRAAARKHRITPDDLPKKLIEMSEKLNTIDNSDKELQKLKQIISEQEKQFDLAAKKLSNARKINAEKMRRNLLKELPDLKLGTADFSIAFNECLPTANGIDDITFMIKTNPGSPFAPLNKSASGGELARLMLGLRVVLSGTNDAHTFVFDEVDTGISGATASAVGARLNRLANTNQALVITHSAQVAGFADHHFKISKNVKNNQTTTSVCKITGDTRINEIARIISGAEITPESITMAKTLIKG